MVDALVLSFSCLLLASQPREVRHAKRLMKKQLRKRRLLAVTIIRQYAVLTCLDVQTGTNKRHLNDYLLYLWWSNVTVNYALLSRAR